jgi:hypothetical protein
VGRFRLQMQQIYLFVLFGEMWDSTAFPLEFVPAHPSSGGKEYPKKSPPEVHTLGETRKPAKVHGKRPHFAANQGNTGNSVFYSLGSPSFCFILSVRLEQRIPPEKRSRTCPKNGPTYC